MIARLVLVIAIWSGGVNAAVAMAQPPAGDDSEVTARELFAAGKYSAALSIYVKLYAERPHPTYLRNIGRCYQNMGVPRLAISSFREYLRQTPTIAASQRALIERYIVEMEELEKRQALAQDAKGKDQRAPAAPTQTPQTPPRLANQDTPVHAKEPGTMRGPARFVVAGTSIAALGVGGFFGWRAISKRRDSDGECMGGCSSKGVSLNDQARTAARVSDVAFGLGAIGAGIATYLFVRSGAPGTEDAVAGRFDVFPELGANRAGVTLARSW